MIDGAQAARTARTYFDSVSGSLGPIGFSIHNTTLQNDVWVVECSYFEFYGAPDRTRYRVEVDPESGGVKRVETIPRQ